MATRKIRTDSRGPFFVENGMHVRPLDGLTDFPEGSKLSTKRIGVQPTIYRVTDGNSAEAWIGHDSADSGPTASNSSDAILARFALKRVS